jgi:hypothetical protein
MPDPAPWPKGSHPDYEAFVVEVHIRKDRNGALRSVRRLQDEVDEKTALSMGHTGGMTEGATALLTEAARTEAMLQSLVTLHNDKTFRDRVLREDEDQQQHLIDVLKRDTLQMLQASLDQLLPDICTETLEQLRHGLKSQKGAY